MSDVLPSNEIDFENPPPIARRSEHLPLLLALKNHPGRSARIEKDKKMNAGQAQALAGIVSRAAAKIGDGYNVVTRFIPEVDHHGVWVTYTPSAVPSAEDAADAKAAIKRAMVPAYPGAIPAESAEITGDGSGQALPPIEDEWELPEPQQIPVGTERTAADA